MEPNSLIGLDPLLLTNNKIFIKDVIVADIIKENSVDFYSFEGHLIKFVEICGIIVSNITGRSHILYIVDDSSGTIECIEWYDTLPDKMISIGTCVRILGKIEVYLNQKKITVKDIYPIVDPNEELMYQCQIMQHKIDCRNKLRIPSSVIDKIKMAFANHTQNEKRKLQTDHSTFKDDLLRHCMNSENMDISLESILSDQALIDSAKKELISQESGTHDRQLTHYFNQILNILEREGRLIMIDTEHVIFRVLEKNTICNIILDIFKKSTKNDIQLTSIMSEMRNMPEYSFINRNVISQCIKLLIEKSIIYSTGDHQYKLLRY
ncbi:hypothetical protein BDB01DRAFT_793210 [Pilobolus umbonatus]|nr:hypothetical protein BDB01DRAFT_793210 [Pilobolus umbonatus]